MVMFKSITNNQYYDSKIMQIIKHIKIRMNIFLIR